MPKDVLTTEPQVQASVEPPVALQLQNVRLDIPVATTETRSLKATCSAR